MYEIETRIFHGFSKLLIVKSCMNILFW